MPLKIESNRLRAVAKSDDAALSAAIAKILANAPTNERDGEWLTLTATAIATPMQILLKPIFTEESPPIGVALYIALPERSLSGVGDAVKKMFGCRAQRRPFFPS